MNPKVGCSKKKSRNEGRPEDPINTKNAVIWSILQEGSNTPLRTIAETLSISPEALRTHISRIGCTLKT
jgi:predicted ArsR family transcriptional regulator